MIYCNRLFISARNFSVSSSVGVKQLTVRDALNMALDEELSRDDRVGLNI